MQVVSIAELWHSTDSKVWAAALERYWQFVQHGNIDLERALDKLSLERIRELDPQGWYDFLRLEYFRWKYTAANRYATTTNSLCSYTTEEGGLTKLFDIKSRLLALAPIDVRSGLRVAQEIRGLGTAGASGLLALMFPQNYGTVDQFAVKALCGVSTLPEIESLKKMKPMALTPANGAMLIGIMARKAADNNRLFKTTVWTPRKIDQILWTYGR